MKTAISATALLISAMTLASGGREAWADEGDATFRVKNTLHDTVSVWVASEKSTKANPWAHVDVPAGEERTVTLRAPDRFVVAVDIGKQRSRSKPIALKEFLTKHPNYVLGVDLVRTFGAGEGQAFHGESVQLNFYAPRKANNKSDDSKDAKPAEPLEELDFGFETQSTDNNNGNQ